MPELWVKGACQGRSDEDGNPLSPYMLIIDAWEDENLAAEQPCLFIGGGAMILPGLFSKRGHYGDIVEIRKEAYNVPDFMLWNVDAREHRINGMYRFILLDVYDGHKKPHGLYHKKYILELKKHLLKDGTLCINYIPDSIKDLEVFSTMLKTVFPETKYEAVKSTDGEVLQIVFFCGVK